jgi:hypothetical protein
MHGLIHGLISILIQLVGVKNKSEGIYEGKHQATRKVSASIFP